MDEHKGGVRVASRVDVELAIWTLVSDVAVDDELLFHEHVLSGRASAETDGPPGPTTRLAWPWIGRPASTVPHARNLDRPTLRGAMRRQGRPLEPRLCAFRMGAVSACLRASTRVWMVEAEGQTVLYGLVRLAHVR